MNKLHYNFYIHKHALKKMLDVVEVPYNLPSLPTEKFGTPEKIAQCVRQRWMVPRGPIKNLVNLVESAGIFILWTDVENDSFDGQIIPDEGGLPVMAINKNMTADRQRFTIAHELGHLVMHYPNYIPTADSNEDEEANRFAAEFLMPRQDVYADLYDNSSFQRLITLKPYWKVSIASLVRRALDLGIINKSRYTSLNVQLSRDGMKKREPTFGLEPEKPTLFKQLIDLHLVDLEYSHRSLAEKMLLSTTELESIIDTYSDRSLRFKILRNTA
jgi:Zn-dependent peptidase ImmA (M78 family)